MAKNKAERVALETEIFRARILVYTALLNQPRIPSDATGLGNAALESVNLYKERVEKILSEDED